MRKGFTLIELLVVVLIIGILAAVALPQYRIAVEKSRMATALPTLRAIMDAQRRYYLSEGEYTNDVDNLDVQFNYTSKTQGEGTRMHYKHKELGSITMYSNNDFIVWNGGKGYVVDYYGAPRASRGGAVGICYSETTPGGRVCKSFGKDTGTTSSNGFPVYALDF